jgi:hypothetical protein
LPIRSAIRGVYVEKSIGRARDTDRREGDEVAVLYLPGERRRFALWTPGLGMAPGVLTAQGGAFLWALRALRCYVFLSP